MANYDVQISYLNESNEYDDLFPQVNISKILPRGLIVMWSGAIVDIPTGWLLCNGSNGTPDLRNKFVLGAGSNYGVGATGGSQTVRLTTAQIPSHNHGASTSTTTSITNNLSVDSNGEHSHEISSGPLNGQWGTVGAYRTGSGTSYAATAWVPGDGSSGNVSTDLAGSHIHTLSGSISASSSSSTSIGSTGSGQAHENMPPYYALCYSMKE